MGVWTKPPVKAEPKPEAPVSSPAPVSPAGKQAAPAPKTKPPVVRSSAPARAAPYQAQPSPPPTAKTAAPGAKARDDADDIVLRGASFDVKAPADDFVLRGSSFTPAARPTAATGFKAGTAPGTPERAAAVLAEQQRVALRQRDLEEQTAQATSSAEKQLDAAQILLSSPRGQTPPLRNPAQVGPLLAAAAAKRDVEAAATEASAPLEQKSEFLGAAQRILAEQAHLDLLDAADKQGIVTAPALLARKRTELAAKYPRAIELNVPLLIPRTDGEGAHPTVKAFVAAGEAERIEIRRQLQELVGQRQAAFAGAGEADRPQAAFEFLQVALLRDAIEDESRRQRGVK